MKLEMNPITGRLDISGMSASEVAQALTYTTTEPVSATVGGVSEGETFDSVPLVEVVDKILHKPLAPVVSLSAQPKGGSYEKGAVLTVELTAVATRKTSDIAMLSYIINTEAESVSSDVSKGGTFKHTLVVSANTTIKASVEDVQGRMATSAEIKYAFRNPIYWGLTDDVPTGIEGLNKIIPTTDSGTLTADYGAYDSKRFVMAVCGSVGDVLNPSGYKIQNSLRNNQVEVECLDGQTHQYTIYYSEVNTQGTAYPVRWNYKLS